MGVDVELNALSSLGIVQDIPPYQLPPQAWNQLNNVRFQDDSIVRLGGKQQVFGTPSVAPYFTLPVINAAQAWWLYASLTKIYVYNGSAHTNITRQTAAVDVDYTVAAGHLWNGTIFQGIPIMNNGADRPQFWGAYNISTKMDNLTNWNANHRCKVMRSFGSFLIALNITKSGVNSPHMIKWSHRAGVGSLPSSWDETDATKDAGENEFGDVMAGLIQDGLPLRGNFYIYKEGSVWRMRPTGTRFIFAFDSFLETAGLLTTNCVALTGDGSRHVFMTNEDVVAHDGTRAWSILNRRMKRSLFARLSTTDYQTSFLFDNPLFKEMWICYPENGNDFPNKALIWNYGIGAEDLGSFSEADVDFRQAAIGPVTAASQGTWSSAVGSWASYTMPWGVTARRRIVVAKPQATKMLALDVGLNNDGSPVNTVVQRVGMAIMGKDSEGNPVVDWKQRKYYGRVWLKFTGGPINIRFGWQEATDGPTTWLPTQSFDPEFMNYIDVEVSGRALAIEVSTTSDVEWEFHGYKVEVSPAGKY